MATSHSLEPASTVEPSTNAVPGQRAVKITRAVTIRKPAMELYEFWRKPENMAKIVPHPISVTRRSAVEYDWSVSGPPGESHPTWTSLIINDHPGELIAWESKPGAEVANAGTVRFNPAPGDEGTEVVLIIEYDPPGGKIGEWFAKLFAEDPAKQVAETLHRFKALMEAGEIPTTEGQPVGSSKKTKRKHK